MTQSTTNSANGVEQIREALALMNSMIACGEDHSNTSRAVLAKAMSALAAIREAAPAPLSYRVDDGSTVVELQGHPMRPVLVADADALQLMWREASGECKSFYTNAAAPAPAGARLTDEEILQQAHEARCGIDEWIFSQTELLAFCHSLLSRSNAAQPTTIERKVYRNSTEWRAYLNARFTDKTSNSFEFDSHRWMYRYTSFDDAGDYDLIYRFAAQPEAAQPATVPDDWRKFVEDCAGTAGGMVNGNNLSRLAFRLLSNYPAQPAPMPVAWRREWNGDDSDLGAYIYASHKDELDTDGLWEPLYAALPLRSLSQPVTVEEPTPSQPKAVSDEPGEREKDANTLIASMKAFADAQYVAGCRVADSSECKGWEAKVKSGKFGKAEMDAHAKMQNHFGAHSGIYAAIAASQSDNKYGGA